jgi:SMI1/KNR4 family protein SUKH-1
MESLTAILMKFREYWLSLGLPVNPGLQPETIDGFERLHNITVPRDLRQYLLTMNGVANSEWDPALNGFLPLAEWENVQPREGHPPEFAFVEWSIWAAWWSFRPDPSSTDRTRVFVTNKETSVVAESLAEFLCMYLKDPHSILR